jgi:hypothetical protein
LHPIVAFVGGKASNLARVAAGELPANLRVVTFLGRTVNVEHSLRFCIDESGRFQRLNAIVPPTAVVLAGGFAVEKRRVHHGVISGVV